MKLGTIASVLAVSCMGLAACEEKQPEAQPGAEAPAVAQPTEPKAVEAPKAPEVAPGEICKEVTAAAKGNDEAKLTSLVAGGAEVLAGEGVKDALVGALGGATCGEAKIEGDKAIVPLTTGAGKKAKAVDGPFIKGADGWKFDCADWLAKNPVKAAKGKKAKAGKKKGKK